MCRLARTLSPWTTSGPSVPSKPSSSACPLLTTSWPVNKRRLARGVHGYQLVNVVTVIVVQCMAPRPGLDGENEAEKKGGR